MTLAFVIFRQRLVRVSPSLAERLGYDAGELAGERLRTLDVDLCRNAEVPGLFALGRGDIVAYLTSYRTKTGERISAAVEYHPYNVDGELWIVGRVALGGDRLKPGGGQGVPWLRGAKETLYELAEAMRSKLPDSVAARAHTTAFSIGHYLAATPAAEPDRRAWLLYVLDTLSHEDNAEGSPLAFVLDKLHERIVRLPR